MSRKILVLFCGGTMIMERNEEGALSVRERGAAVQLLQNLEPRLKELADITVEYIDNIDSTNMTPQHWDLLTKKIGDCYENYDGFVVIHGTDTMAYTASALTFSLNGIGKPVVLTGSQIPGSAIESDARTNLINSVRTALLDLSGVYIVFHERIILGARSSKTSESKLNAFSTKNAPPAGEIRVDIRLQEILPKRHIRPLKVHPGFESEVLVVTLTPGKSTETIRSALEHGRTKGLILRAYSTGNIPYSFLPLLEEARKYKIPVAVTSQCLHGSTSMERYDVGHQALKLGAIQLYDMSIECAVTKLMWTLKNFPYQEVPGIMQRNFAGEINTEGTLYA